MWIWGKGNWIIMDEKIRQTVLEKNNEIEIVNKNGTDVGRKRNVLRRR